MIEHLSKPCTAFEGSRLLLSGPLVEVVLAVKGASEGDASKACLVFDDATGRVLDFDLRGSKGDIITRLSQPSAANVNKLPSRPIASPAASDEPAPEPRGRGRPKLGVVGREVTLLPRHWDWLAAQPGGASVVLRKLVDEARRTGGALQEMREAQEAAYHFMSAMAGDLPGFEEATRALFANDRDRVERHAAAWPGDIRAYAIRLAFGEPSGGTPGRTQGAGDER